MIYYRRDVSGFTLRWDGEVANHARANGFWANRTLADFAKPIASAMPDRIMVREGDRIFTARALWDEAAALASALRDRGYGPGDVLAFQLPNWAEANVLGLASAMGGFVLAPIVPIYREAEVAFILAEARAKAFFIPATFRNFDYRAMAETVQPRLGRPIDVFVLRGDPGRWTSYDTLIGEGDRTAIFPPVDPDALRIILFTSGTTGRSKGVFHTHNSITAENIKTAARGGYDETYSFYMASPVTHLTGFLYAVNMVWSRNVPVVLAPVWEPERAFDEIKAYSCAIMGGATPFLKALVEIAEARDDYLDSLRAFACGGTSIPADLVATALRRFPNAKVSRAFGATEVPTITLPPKDRTDIVHATQTDGLAFEVDMRIVDPDTGDVLPPDTEGEVVVKCPQMFFGYIRDDDNAEAFDENGYFRMGDIGRLDKDGWFTVTGRKKDLINRLGEKVSAKEIEDILFTHPDVADVAIVAKPSDRTGEAVCAFVIPRAGKQPTLAELARFVESHGVAKQKLPEYLELVEEFPRVPSGKVKKDILRQMAAAGAGQGIGSAESGAG